MSYVLIVLFITSGILYGLERDIKISYIDSLFTCTSAITTTGLIVLDTSILHKTSQVLIFLLILLGNGILLSLVPLLKRIIFTYLPKMAISNTNEGERLYAKLQLKACILVIVVVLIFWISCVVIGISIFLIMGLDPEYNFFGTIICSNLYSITIDCCGCLFLSYLSSCDFLFFKVLFS